jgi:ribose transport system substrate-binding protein
MFGLRHSALALLALTGVCACSSSSNNNSTTSSSQAVNIAWITKGQCNTFFAVSRQGARLAGQDLTSASGAPVNVDIMEPNDCGDGGTTTTTTPDASASGGGDAMAEAASGGGADAQTPTDAATTTPTDAAAASDAMAASSDAAAAGDAMAGATADAAAPDPCSLNFAGAQRDLIQQAIDQHVGAIGIDVSSPACENDTINAAVAAGIPVITWDSDAPTSNRNTYYGMDNVAATKSAVDVLANLIGGSGKIAMMTSMFKDSTGTYQLSQSQSYIDRVTAFNDEIAKYPGITVVATLPCTGNSVTDTFCAQQVEKQLTATPDLKGFFFARGKILRDVNLAMTAPQFTAARKAGTLSVVAFDAPSDALANIQAGYADLVINQKLFGFGYDVVSLAYDMLTIHRQVASFTDSGWDTICPNNIAQFAAALNAQDFRQPLDKCQYLP